MNLCPVLANAPVGDQAGEHILISGFESQTLGGGMNERYLPGLWEELGLLVGASPRASDSTTVKWNDSL